MSSPTEDFKRNISLRLSVSDWLTLQVIIASYKIPTKLKALDRRGVEAVIKRFSNTLNNERKLQ